jgi:N-acetylglucosaminyldiphosphoundecaprenol N-acetyl-beta-D-mannosaminyltransferase
MGEGMETRSILGIPVSAFASYDHALDVIGGRVKTGRKTFCVAINPEKVYRAQRDAELRRTLLDAHVRICDGVGVSFASVLLHGKPLARCTGIELFFRLIGRARDEGWGVFLLGASARSNAGAAEKLRSLYPGLRIAGRQDGFFKDAGEAVDRVNQSGADLLFVAMGSPRQEFWIRDQMPRLRTPLCMGVGGSFDVLSGEAKWAPAIFRKTGTEWLFRLLSQPSRARRQLVLPLYTLDVLKAAITR